MSKRDFIHAAVVEALKNDNWAITDDPYLLRLVLDEKYFYIDLGVTKTIDASKGREKVLIELKSFDSLSVINEFHTVLGQFLNYRDALEIGGIKRELYLGVSFEGYQKIFNSPFIKRQIGKYNLKLVIVDIHNKKIIRWIK